MPCFCLETSIFLKWSYFSLRCCRCVCARERFFSAFSALYSFIVLCSSRCVLLQLHNFAEVYSNNFIAPLLVILWYSIFPSQCPRCLHCVGNVPGIVCDKSLCYVHVAAVIVVVVVVAAAATAIVNFLVDSITQTISRFIYHLPICTKLSLLHEYFLGTIFLSRSFSQMYSSPAAVCVCLVYWTQ